MHPTTMTQNGSAPGADDHNATLTWADGPAATARRRARERQRRRARLLKRALGLALALALVTGTLLALRPQAVPVDLVRVGRGPLTVTVEESGKTRVQDRYVLSAPVAGRVARIGLRAGDAIAENQVVATIAPSPAALLDVRARGEAEARLSAALFAERQARAQTDRATAAQDQARREFERLSLLLQRGATTQRAFDDAQFAVRTSGEDVESAGFAAKVAREEARRARAVLDGGGLTRPGGDVPVRSPVAGVVLRVAQEQEMVVTPGTPLIEVGDPSRLDIVVDVLSADAVRITPGARVAIERWGGTRALNGHVHRVEPQAFTRLSALGIEEQRVNVIIHPEDAHVIWRALGDGYRVEAAITVWHSPSVLRAPSSAIFRSQLTGGDETWAVYRIDTRQVARLVRVSIGHRTAGEVEITEGLVTGDLIVRYPTDRLGNGNRVEPRR